MSVSRHKKVPVIEPEFNGYLYYAYNLIALSNCGNYKEWLHSNFIQINCDSNYFMGFCGTIWDSVKHECLTKKMLLKLYPDIIEFFKQSIEAGYYIHTFVDEFYIPGKKHFQQKRYYQEMMLFGFDEDTQSFQSIGYNQDLLFGEIQVNYSDFKEAFLRTEVDEITVTLFPTLNLSTYKINVADIKDQLDDYINGRNTYQRLNMQFIDFYIPKVIETETKYEQVYGLEVYNVLIEYFQRLMTGELEWDSRQLHLLWEHKMNMQKRLEYLYEHHYLTSSYYSEEYGEIAQKLLVLRNRQLKYKLSGEQRHIIKIIEEIEEIRVKERDILLKVINELEAALG